MRYPSFLASRHRVQPRLSGHGVRDELRVGSERRNPTGDPINFSQLEDRHHVFDLANMLADAIRLVGAQLIRERRVSWIDFAILWRGMGISAANQKAAKLLANVESVVGENQKRQI